MPEGVPKNHVSIESSKVVERPFDWEITKSELLAQLRKSNDPRSFLEYLLQFPNEHIETECWDDYLLWVYDHSDEMLELARRGIPDIADQVIMVLTDTYTFIDERADGFEEHGYSSKKDALHQKLVAFCNENFSSFWVDDASEPYRFGLRLPALSKIMWLCERGPETMLLRLMAHTAAIETIKRGFTEEDAREDKPFAHSDMDFDIDTALSDIILDEEIAVVAQAVAARTGTQLDLRREGLRESPKEEKSQAHHKHLRGWVTSTLELEGHAKGASKELQERFGIVNFNHYPIEVLRKQYDLRDAQVPYGVLIGTQYDWNDAFSSHYSTEKMLKDFSEQLSEHGSNLRVVEVDSPRALAQQFVSLERQYGTAHKITFAILRAHGREEVVSLGNRYDQTLSKKRLGSARPENLQRFFVEQPNIIFDSCSVGAYGGLAESVAAALGGVVQGPEGISHGIEKIDVSGEGEKLALTATLHEGKKINTHV